MTDNHKTLDTEVVVTVEGQQYTFSSADQLGIDRDNIEKELEQQAVLYSWFSVQHERRKAERRTAEAKLKETEARLFLKYKQETDKKVTVDMAKAMVTTDPEMVHATAHVHLIERDERLLNSFATAFAQRKDMLTALVRNRSTEMGTYSPAEVQKIKSRYQ